MRERKYKEIEIDGKKLYLYERNAFDVYTIVEIYNNKIINNDSDWIEYWVTVISQSLMYNILEYDKVNKLESLIVDNTHFYEVKKHKEIQAKNNQIQERNDIILNKRKELEDTISKTNLMKTFTFYQLYDLNNEVRKLEKNVGDTEDDKKKVVAESLSAEPTETC